MDLRHLLVRAVVLALIGIVTHAAATELRSPARRRALPQVLPVTPGSVERISVTSRDTTVEFTRDANGGWHPANGTPAQSAALLNTVEDAVLPLLAYRAISADPEDPQFGLSPAELVLHVSERNGHYHTVLLGAPTFNGAGFFARLNNSTRIYLVARQAMENFRSLLSGGLVRSPDPLETAVSKMQANRGRQATQVDVTPYLQQVLDAGAEMPPEPR